MIRIDLSSAGAEGKGLLLGLLFPTEFEKVEVVKSTGDGSEGEVKHGPPIATWCEIHRLDPASGKSVAIVARNRARLAKPHQRVGLKILKENKLVVTGKQTQRDLFSYEEGRKKALRRALANYGIPKVARTKVWAAYHSRPRPTSRRKAPSVIVIMEGSPAVTGPDGFKEAIITPDVANTLHAGEQH